MSMNAKLDNIHVPTMLFAQIPLDHILARVKTVFRAMEPLAKTSTSATTALLIAETALFAPTMTVCYYITSSNKFLFTF